MPHAVFNSGAQTTSARGSPRQLVPGIDPGGSRLGHPTKPAFLIKDIDVHVETWTTAGDFSALLCGLALSQEEALTPALFLPSMSLGGGSADSTAEIVSLFRHKFQHFIGTVWAAKWVGWFGQRSGAGQGWTIELHVDYEVVDIPWMDWLLRWDFLDNISDASLEY